MPSNLAQKLATPHHKNLGMDLRSRTYGPTKVDHKPLVIEELSNGRRAVGRVVARAIEIARTTKQAVTREIGLGDDQAPISKWIAAKERPHLDRLWDIDDAMREAIALAFCEEAGLTVQTIVTIPRTRRDGGA